MFIWVAPIPGKWTIRQQRKTNLKLHFSFDNINTFADSDCIISHIFVRPILQGMDHTSLRAISP